MGQPTSLAHLLAQTGNPLPREGVAVAGVQTRAGATLQIGPAFDHLGNVYKVIKDMPDGRVLCKSVWGALQGNEAWFDRADVVRMVNEKRG